MCPTPGNQPTGPVGKFFKNCLAVLCFFGGILNIIGAEGKVICKFHCSGQKYFQLFLGLAKSANSNLLYLPKESGGLNLPSLSSLYKQLQISRQCQLLTSSDSCVRRIAEKGLQCEELAQWKKFRPAITVRVTTQQDTSLSRKALRVAAKRSVMKGDDHT